RLRLPEVTLGIAPGLGAMVVPYRRWPAASGVLADMNRYGRELTAADARELGIVDAVAPDIAGLVSAAIDRVRALSEHDLEPIPDGPVELGVLDDGEAPAGEALDPEVVGIIDRAIRAAAAAPTLGDALEIGYRAFGASACTAAASENITAFVTRGAKGG
ncbi:MAG: 3-hydroxyacyl-CoA dehydrogenase/enoyl-CoA hydratase family protein, partial [Acidimicrobiales bacterium]